MTGAENSSEIVNFTQYSGHLNP